MAVLLHAQILRLHAAIVAARLTGSRNALLGGIPPALVDTLPTAADPSSQILSDLHGLNAVERLSDGTMPLKLWLENAAALVGQRIEAGVLREAIEAIRGGKTTERPGLAGTMHTWGRGTAKDGGKLPMPAIPPSPPRRDHPRATPLPAAPKAGGSKAEGRRITVDPRRFLRRESEVWTLPFDVYRDLFGFLTSVWHKLRVAGADIPPMTYGKVWILFDPRARQTIQVEGTMRELEAMSLESAGVRPDTELWVMLPESVPKER